MPVLLSHKREDSWKALEITEYLRSYSIVYYLDGYSEQLKRDMKDFRDNFGFDHD